MTNAIEKHRVTVNWSDMLTETPINDLIAWVKSYPHHGDIHVFVGSVRHSPIRRLQNELQMLGCRVTMRTQSTLCKSA